MRTAPNPVTVVWSVWRSLRRVRAPRPAGSRQWDHDLLVEPLLRLRDEGPQVLGDLARPVADYVASLTTADPDDLDRDGALAFWVNLYNAGTLLLVADAWRAGEDSVLRVPGGFRRPFVTIAGEDLSLDAIEHAKLRRLRDPRIHAALVCGSVSCPTLRSEPYRGHDLSRQLDDQMRRLLSGGALTVDRQGGRVGLSRIFLWFGADFVRPHRMPRIQLARRSSVLDALVPWIEPDVSEWIAANRPRIEFHRYDWGLACAVR